MQVHTPPVDLNPDRWRGGAGLSLCVVHVFLRGVGVIKALFSVLIHVAGHASCACVPAGNTCSATLPLTGPGDTALWQPHIQGRQEGSWGGRVPMGARAAAFDYL